MSVVGVPVSVAVLASFALASGCASVESSYVLTGPPSEPTIGEVRVFLESQDAPGGYREIAIIEARSNFGAGMPAAVERLQAEAQKIGANALIGVRIDQGSTIISVTALAVRYPAPGR